MSKTIKVGLIGAGFVSDLHAYAFQAFCQGCRDCGGGCAG